MDVPPVQEHEPANPRRAEGIREVRQHDDHLRVGSWQQYKAGQITGTIASSIQLLAPSIAAAAATTGKKKSYKPSAASIAPAAMPIEASSGIPTWVWWGGGIALAAVIGAGIYTATRPAPSPKRGKRAIEADEEQE